GSATRLGDAVELGALLEVHAGRERPLPVGTLKATMGHMEAASGLAGLLRALIIGQDGRIPPQPHATPPAAALRPPLVVGEGVVEGPRVAVSSFGIGGSNAHVVLRPAEVTAPATHASGPLPLLLSAHGEEALRAHATRVAEVLPALPWPDVCGTAARGRSAGPWRLAVVGRSAEEAAEGLAGAAPREALELPRVAWLFPGQGPGLARGQGLADRHVAARDAFDEVFATADPLIGASLRDAIAAGTTDVGLLQVGVFAVSMALARTLLALGEPPVAVAGHSSGEVAAACVAGVLSLEDAVRLLVARGEVLRRSAPGGMAAVIGPAELVTLPEGPVGIAAVNHDGETVISGPTDALAEAVADLR
ncbi:MAG: type I polyketide synthase, partial [Myxococcales bacterium]|nr:type I polyketide synthase [Myxococcales bacterium]